MTDRNKFKAAVLVAVAIFLGACVVAHSMTCVLVVVKAEREGYKMQLENCQLIVENKELEESVKQKEKP